MLDYWYCRMFNKESFIMVHRGWPFDRLLQVKTCYEPIEDEL